MSRESGTATCHDCGVLVNVERTTDGEKVVLDRIPTLVQRDGPRMYRIESFADRTFERANRAGILGYAIHEDTCPSTTKE